MAEQTLAEQYKEILVTSAQYHVERHDLYYANNEGKKRGKTYAEFLTERAHLKAKLSEIENTPAEDILAEDIRLFKEAATRNIERAEEELSMSDTEIVSLLQNEYGYEQEDLTIKNIESFRNSCKKRIERNEQLLALSDNDIAAQLIEEETDNMTYSLGHLRAESLSAALGLQGKYRDIRLVDRSSDIEKLAQITDEQLLQIVEEALKDPALATHKKAARISGVAEALTGTALTTGTTGVITGITALAVCALGHGDIVSETFGAIGWSAAMASLGAVLPVSHILYKITDKLENTPLPTIEELMNRAGIELENEEVMED